MTDERAEVEVHGGQVRMTVLGLTFEMDPGGAVALASHLLEAANRVGEEDGGAS